MAVLFKAMHSIDIDANEIREKIQIPQEFENFISDLINFITNNSNVKNYKIHDDNTQTVACVKRIITYANRIAAILERENIAEQIHDQSVSIADKLLRVEVDAQQRIEATGRNVKRGSLIQALIRDENGSLYFVLAKVEHREWYDGESLLKNLGFPNDKKNVWKSAVFQVSLDEDGTVGSVITNKYRDIKDKKELKTLGTYSVKKDAEIKKIKLVLKTGDQIAILAADDDSILIVKNGDKDNPYFVSADFLMGCSDYKGK